MLEQHGVTGYPFNDFLRHYRLALICILANVTIWLGSADLAGVTGRELDLLNGAVDDGRLFSLVIDQDLAGML